MACACNGMMGFDASETEHSDTQCIRVVCACSAKVRLTPEAKRVVIEGVVHRYSRCFAADGAPLPWRTQPLVPQSLQ